MTKRTQRSGNIPTFSLKLEPATSCFPARGFTALNPEQWPFERFRFPELGPQRGYKTSTPVVDIFGRNYRVVVELTESAVPEGGTINFYESKEQVTPFALVPEKTEEMETLISEYHRKVDWFTEEQRKEVVDFFRATSYKVFFYGQPRFVQGAVYPSHNGKAASPLLCLETGWGDCGNINIFIAVEDNIPVKAWLEANCA